MKSLRKIPDAIWLVCNAWFGSVVWSMCRKPAHLKDWTHESYRAHIYNCAEENLLLSRIFRKRGEAVRWWVITKLPKPKSSLPNAR